MVAVNAFKTKLSASEVQIGLWSALASANAAEIAAGAGFDWLLLEGEHAPNDVRSLQEQLRAVSAYPVSAIGRPPVGETWVIKQYLDIGFQTLLIPMVDTAEQAQQAARAMRYPPAGDRGVGAALARASGYNRDAAYLRDADDQACLLVQVESVTAIVNLDAIARTEGVDGVFIGPSDLAASMGLRGAPGRPEVVAQVEAAIAAIRAAGKPAGILTGDEALARRYIELGCVFVGVGNDVGLLVKATSDLAARFAGAAAPKASAGAGSVY